MTHAIKLFYQPKLQKLTSLLIPNLPNSWISLSIHTNGSSTDSVFLHFPLPFTVTKSILWLPSFTNYQGLSTHSFSAATLPELRLPIFPNEPTADKPLKLLLSSHKFWNLLDFLNLEELISPMLLSVSSSFLIFTTANRPMVLRQNGQTGGFKHAVVGLGLLWQQRASVQCAHIWWPQSWTSIVHTCSKHMEHSSESLLTCRIIGTPNRYISSIFVTTDFS